MAHPFHEHRQTKKEHSRVGHITKGYARGGSVKHSDEAADRKLISKMLSEHEKKETAAEGHKSKHRMDRPHRAKGGRVGKKGNARTIVNVITGGHPAGGAVPPGPPMMPPPAPPMGVAPAGAMPPPMAAKPPMMPPPGVGGPPPMPMRAKGGRIGRASGGRMPTPAQIVATNRSRPIPSSKETQDAMSAIEKAVQGPMGRAKGGRVHKPHGSPVFNESLKAGTQVQHTDGKDDGKDIGRGRVVTFWTGGKVKGGGGYGPKQTPTRARGGKVESSDAIAPATKMPGGGGGGKARLFKEHRAERNYAKPAH